MTIPKSQYNLNQIDSIVEDNDEVILQALGFEVFPNGSVQTSCPIHGGDNPNGFSYDPDLKRWRCWTHSCHDKHGTGLIGLVRCLNDLNFIQSIEFILDTCGYDRTKLVKRTKPSDYTGFIRNRKKILKQQAREGAYEDRIFDDRMIADKSPVIPYFLNRGFDQETLKTFEAFAADDNPRKPLFGYACFPIRNLQNQIVGFSGRRIKNITKECPKWRYAPSNIELGNHLFGINHTHPFLTKSSTALIVEGPLDLLKCWQAGIFNVVTPFSANRFTNVQRKILMKLGVRNLIIAYDPDEAGYLGTKMIKEKSLLYFNTRSINDKYDKDPGEMTCAEIDEYIKPYMEM